MNRHAIEPRRPLALVAAIGLAATVLASAPLGATVLASAPLGAAAYTNDVWNSTYYSPQTTSYNCVPASTLTWLNYIPGSTRLTQDAIYTYERQWMATTLSRGVDPRGWARGMWYYNASGTTSMGFQDYDYPGRQQAQANSELEMGVYATGQPAGAIVAAGDHAYLVVGFQATSDPKVTGSSLLGFYVIDPWYGSGLGSIGSLPRHGPYNIAPNSYVTLANWNTHYYLPDVNEGSYYYGRFDTILRSSVSSAPVGGLIGVDNPPPSWADAHPPAPVQVAMSPAIATGSTRSVGVVVLDGIQQNMLAEGNALGVDLSSVSIGSTVRVESATGRFPSYYLTEVRSHGTTVAVALATDESGGVQFGGIRATLPGYRLPDASYQSQVLRDHGIATGPTRLTWGWSTESMDPFVPVVEVANGSGTWNAVGGLHLAP